MEKSQGKTFNKSIGYQSIKRGERQRRLATEIKGAIWHDRKLLESIVSMPGERFKNHRKIEKWH